MKNTVKTFLAGALILGIFSVPHAYSMCAYNRVQNEWCKETIVFECNVGSRLNCGLFCASNFNFIDQNKRKCRAGTSGKVRGCMQLPTIPPPLPQQKTYCTVFTEEPTYPNPCTANVEKHGWVDITVKAFYSDGLVSSWSADCIQHKP